MPTSFQTKARTMNPGHPFRLVAALFLVAALSACGRNDPATFIASAQTFLAKADYNAAIIELKNALNLAPDNAEARFLLATALLDSGNASAAETEVRKAIDLKYSPDAAYPLLARTLLRQAQFKKLVSELGSRPFDSAQAKSGVGTSLGLAYLGLGQKAEARATLTAALAAQPANADAKVALALVTATEGDLAGALTQVDAALTDAPNNVEGLLLKADIEGALGKRDESLRTLERVVEIRPDSYVARFALVSKYVGAGQLDKAKLQYEALKKMAPADPRTSHSEALVALAEGNKTAARDAIQKVIQAVPDYLPSRMLAGIINYQLGAYSAAEDSLRVVVTKVPDNDAARRILAATYVRQGHAAQAMETLEPALRRAPDDPTLLRMAGEIQFALGAPARATDYFSRANALDKGNVAGQVRLAQIQLTTGDANRALADLEGLATTEPARQEVDLALISAHLSRREFDKALAAALAMEKKQPNSPAAQQAKGIAYTAKGDLPNARASFEKALALDPKYIGAAFNLARLDLAARNYDGARKRYEQMLADNPKNESALLALAEILVLTKAPTAEIRSALQRAIAANPTSLRAHVALINYNGQIKDWPAALAAAQAAQTALPDNPRITEMLGSVQLAAGDTNQALATLRRAAEEQPDNPEAMLRLADAQMKAKDFDGALVSLRATLAKQPDNPGVLMALAASYIGAGRTDAGVAEARKIQKQRPDSAAGYMLEGEIQARGQKWPDAIAAYRAALVRQPSPYLAVRLHSLLLSGGKTDEAAAFAQKWLNDNPKDVAMRNYLAQRALSAKDYRGAVAQLRPALQLDPDNVTMLNNMAWALGELGDPKAIEYAERAYTLAPSTAAAADTYGWLLFRRGDTARSVEILRKALDLSPVDPEIRLHLAKALLKSGDKDGARKELDVLAKPETPAAVRAESEKLRAEL
jgi:putative PEP-CTERM system TPR-repeat lipoprotein